ncbi:hypothetical protein SLEP1_g18690 [Rubroshorea leprosula]|uniref:MATH domain-containing protein n=1 Tax=Rubroshorea leprosula TaxID=152421 RepID=A0AAV5J8Z9_9ROSI|nr:hypothetical protein SLEP1_g18690 [Rubroshorea leprosula]
MASNPVSNSQDGVARSISDAPPTHYVVKIQLFSLLLKNSVEKYESGDFEAGGDKWKLVLYPSGNKSRNVKDYISLYLAIADTDSRSSEVCDSFKLFLLDQNQDNYLVVHDATEKERRFRGLRNQWGFDQFLPLRTFNDVASGYLVDDTCVFGAEVKIQMYPKGRRHGLGSHISLYLALADPKATPSSSKILAEFTLRMVDQMQGRHISGKVSYWFSGSSPENGWAKYVTFGYFNLPSNGCLVKDVCVVEAEGIKVIECNIKEKEYDWLNACAIGYATSLEVIPSLQEVFEMEGCFHIVVVPMGGCMVLLKGDNIARMKELVDNEQRLAEVIDGKGDDSSFSNDSSNVECHHVEEDEEVGWADTLEAVEKTHEFRVSLYETIM